MTETDDDTKIGQRIGASRPGRGHAGRRAAGGNDCSRRKDPAVVGPDDIGAGVPITDVGDKLVLPGLVDTHVHINEPGRTDWEGFETGTKAAAAGGITTLVDMPLNSSPVTTTVAALDAKRQAAAGSYGWMLVFTAASCRATRSTFGL